MLSGLAWVLFRSSVLTARNSMESGEKALVLYWSTDLLGPQSVESMEDGTSPCKEWRSPCRISMCMRMRINACKPSNIILQSSPLDDCVSE